MFVYLSLLLVLLVVACMQPRPGLGSLHLAAGEGRAEEISRMLQNLPPITVADLDLAASEGRAQDVSRMLLILHPDFFSVYVWDFLDPIVVAARYGHDNAVELLLKGESLDQLAYDEAISFAAKHGHEKVVAVLLKDGRVDPSCGCQSPLIWAAHKGNDGVAALLLVDTRVDPRANNQDALKKAAENGHDKVVQLLLKHPLVDPSVGDQEALRLAMSKGHAKVVEVLLQDPRVDPRVPPQAGPLAVSCEELFGDYLVKVMVACAEGDLQAILDDDFTGWSREQLDAAGLIPQRIAMLMSRSRNHPEILFHILRMEIPPHLVADHQFMDFFYSLRKYPFSLVTIREAINRYLVMKQELRKDQNQELYWDMLPPELMAVVMSHL